MYWEKKKQESLLVFKCIYVLKISACLYKISLYIEYKRTVLIKKNVCLSCYLKDWVVGIT